MSRRDPALDGFKGILISLIVLGHNYFFSAAYQNFHAFIYNFHVVCFLLFPFLFLVPGREGKPVWERLFRVLVPHFFFLALAAAAVYLVNIRMGGEPLAPWLWEIGTALLVQNETMFREAFGAGLFWFLPAFAMLMLMLHAYSKASPGQRALIGVVALVWHASMGVIDNDFVNRMPFSLSLVTYVFVIGLAVHAIHARVTWTRGTSLLAVFIWLVCSWLVLDYRFYNPLAGDLYRTPLSLAQPLLLLLQDAFLVLTFFALLRLAYLLGSSVVALVGRYSLQVFLIHSFVWQALWRGGLNRLDPETGVDATLAAAASFAVTMGLTLAVAMIIERTPLQRFIFPTCFADWKLAR
ncbi:MAG: hypothetical protein GY701_29210 [Sulfitobacter sp.]|nr:hypothetical protein [Sulfitobacter sp.]